jgi:hypothetical protein
MPDSIKFSEGEEPEFQTGISPECQRGECGQCPGLGDHEGKPSSVFTIATVFRRANCRRNCADHRLPRLTARLTRSATVPGR